MSLYLQGHQDDNKFYILESFDVEIVDFQCQMAFLFVSIFLIHTLDDLIC